MVLEPQGLSMPDKPKRQGTQMAMGKSDGGIVPEKPGNAGGGKAATPMQRSGAGPGRTQRRKEPVATRLERISQRAREHRREVFTNLYQHLDDEMLEECFREEEKDKASGVDGVTKEQYGGKLEENLQRLGRRLHRGSYRPLPVRRRYIPKANGKRRPLGIPALEDKLVQRGLAKLLGRVYEESFHDFSFGFRPQTGRSCHVPCDAARAAPILVPQVSATFNCFARR
jgi:RNA-directed DNA polymerase